MYLNMKILKNKSNTYEFYCPQNYDKMHDISIVDKNGPMYDGPRASLIELSWPM